MLYSSTRNPNYCYTLEYKIEQVPFMSQFHFGYAAYRNMLIIAICDMLEPLLSKVSGKYVSVTFKGKNKWEIKDNPELPAEIIAKAFPLIGKYLDKITQTCYWQDDEKEEDAKWGITFMKGYEWQFWDNLGVHACGLDLEIREDREQLQVTRMLLGFYNHI